MSTFASVPPKLIGSIRVEPSTVRPGQPVLIQVCDPEGKPYTRASDVTIEINGVSAPSLYCQFLQPGARPIVIRAVRGAAPEMASTSVRVEGPPLAFRLSGTEKAPTAMPILLAKLDRSHPYRAMFTLDTPDSVKRVLAEKLADSGREQSGGQERTTMNGYPAPPSQLISTCSRAPISAATEIMPPTGVSYEWDFGDGQKATTTSPNVTHDYYPAIRGSQTAYSFETGCTVVHDKLSVRRTLVLHSAYGLCRNLGTAVPHVTGDTHATFQQAGFSASLIVSNPEPVSAMTLNRMAIVPVNPDTRAATPAPVFIELAKPITVSPRASSGVGVYAALNQLGLPESDTPGFTVYFSGSMKEADSQRDVPVRFSRHFRIRKADARSAHRFQPVVLDLATTTMALPALADPRSATTKGKVRTAVQARMEKLAADISPAILPAIAPAALPVGLMATVEPGTLCDPDNIATADAASANALELSCQLTSQVTEVRVAGAFQNAQMGDLILVPGGDDVIGKLLHGLYQNYSHSGIMTQNHGEVTHCTASEDRYGDYMKGLGGAEGIQPDVLEYGWPGSITQTIDNAVNGQEIIDSRNCKHYNIREFVSAAPPDYSLSPPLVFKPLPENEAAVRPVLRTVAASARARGAQIDAQGNITFQPGGCYYSFYGYSNPQIGLGFGDPAPASAQWAAGLTPAVCSSFIWLCMKANKLGLLGPSEYATKEELSQAAIAAGASVEPTTLDGLFFYSEAERLSAATTLDTIFKQMAMDKEGFFGHIPILGPDIASAIADQVVNMFVFGDPDKYGKSDWKKPGEGNVVSPSNILWWNPPLFGWSEPAQYLQAHTEVFSSSKWTPFGGTGTISGVVTLDGKPAADAEVLLYDGMSSLTDAGGRYTLSAVPEGCYALKASVVQNGSQYSNGLQGQIVNLTAANPNMTADVSLATLPSDFRDVTVICQITNCDHSDILPLNEHGPRYDQPHTYHIELGPDAVASGCDYSYDYGDGGYFTITFDVKATLAQDLSVQVTVVWRITDDGSGKAQNSNASHPLTFSVARDEVYSGSLSGIQASGFGFTNGPADFSISVFNNPETS